MEYQNDGLVVINQSQTTIKIMNKQIIQGAAYTVPSSDILNWCKNAKLRIACRGSACSIIVYGTPLAENQATDWMNSVSKGDIVYDL